MDPFLPDDAKLAAIRELLPSVGSGIRMDTTVAGPVSAETDRAVHEVDAWELRVGRGGPDRADELLQRADEARSVIAAVVAATPDRVLLAPGCVAILAALLALAGVDGAGRRIVILGGLRAELHGQLRELAHATGAALEELTEEHMDGALRPDTTLMVVSHVDVGTGAIHDPARLASWARSVGALLVLDAAWTVGAVPVDAPGSGADVMLMEGHRWLLGPEGVAAAWLSEGIDMTRIAGLVDPLPHTALLGQARSVGWLLMYVGLPWAFERAERLAGRLRDLLASIEGVDVRTGVRGMSTTVPFRITGWTADEAAAELVRRSHAQLGVDRDRDTLLAGVGAWISDEELALLAESISVLARYTPQTVPRRPLLTLLGEDGGPRAR